MSKGIVIFAQNNSSIDYIKLSIFAAKQAQHYLDAPVSLVTDSMPWLNTNYPDHPFDQVIEVHEIAYKQKKAFFDGALSSKSLEWKNFARYQAYALSPYDTTLVIDSDFIINSGVLKPAFNRDADLQIYSQSMDLAHNRSTDEFERINDRGIPFYWATAFVFKKNPMMESFFDLISYIRTNWDYYKMLYNIDASLFRNDYAFSIAIHILNSKMDGNFTVELPGKMIYTRDKDVLVEIQDGTMQFLMEKKNYNGEYIMAKTTNLDVHVMNKFSLSRFIDGGSGV
jgi:hypothetical protein